MSNTITELAAKGPRPIQQAEADWLVAQAGMALSGPAAKAFALGVALGQGVSHREWVKSAGYLEAKGAQNAAELPAPKALPVQKQHTIVEGVTASQMREWAAANGFNVNPRGRLSQEIKDAYAYAAAGKKVKTADSNGEPASERRRKPSGDTGARAARDKGRTERAERRRKPATKESSAVNGSRGDRRSSRRTPKPTEASF